MHRLLIVQDKSLNKNQSVTHLSYFGKFELTKCDLGYLFSI